MSFNHRDGICVVVLSQVSLYDNDNHCDWIKERTIKNTTPDRCFCHDCDWSVMDFHRNDVLDDWIKERIIKNTTPDRCFAMIVIGL